MSIVDKAVDTVTKNVSLEIKLKDAEAKIAALQQEKQSIDSSHRKQIDDLKASLSQAEDKNASLEKKLVELQSNPLTFDALGISNTSHAAALPNLLQSEAAPPIPYRSTCDLPVVRD